MNRRIELDEDPDGRGHVADARPHAHHGTGMVIGLEGGAALAFGENDEGIEDLVELGQVEPPAPEGQPFIPESSHICRIWQSLGSEMNGRVVCLPNIGGGVVGHRIAEAAGAMHLAESIHRAHERMGLRIVREGPFEGIEHGHARHCGIDGQEDVVEDDKGLEEPRLANGPWFVSPAPVVGVGEHNRGRIDSGNGERDGWLQYGIEDVGGNGMRRAQAGGLEGRRDGWRGGIGGEFEELAGRKANVKRRARHGGCYIRR